MRYRRDWTPGATYFFTVNLEDRRSDLLVSRMDALRKAFAHIKRLHPFQIDACVILPDHLHTVWTLPEGDSDYALRWSLIKAGFSRAVRTHEAINGSRRAKRERGVWQRRYWEHRIRDDADLAAHIEYVHWNPVKHGYVEMPEHWPHSSVHKFIADGRFAVTRVADVASGMVAYASATSRRVNAGTRDIP